MVGECDDSWLNDARRTQISADDVRTAVLGAGSGPVAEGAVGAGAGMICFGWKGGIGTAVAAGRAAASRSACCS